MKLELKDERGLGSLPIIADWQEWWKAWGPQIAKEHGKQGWILFLLDAHEKVQEVSMTLSRILRNKPDWDSTGWSEKEYLNIENQTGEALAWYERNAPSPMRDAPEWAQFLFSAQHGNLAVLARMGREQRALQEQGYLVATLDRSQNLALGGDAAEIVTREAD